MATRRLTKTGSFNLGRQSPKNDLSILDNKHITLPDEIFTLQLNILEMEAWLLPSLVLKIFKTFLLRFDYQKVSPMALREFIIDICDAYLEVPYHNLHHATNVLHITYILLEKCDGFRIFNQDILFATLIAAFAHDVGHPGHNNLFEINSFSDLAIKYNDMSVLEQHHCSLAFELIKKHNLHSLWSREEFVVVRQTIVSCILGTDMAKHKEQTESLKSIHLSVDGQMTTSQQITLCKLLLHAADIGNPILEPTMCEEWSRLVAQEFHNQGQKERQLGLVISTPFDIENELSFFSGEMKYIQFVCLPYWKALDEAFSGFNDELNMVVRNLNSYTQKHDQLAESIDPQQYS